MNKKNYLLSGFLLLGSLSCELKDPVLPSWENSATVPLITAQYSMSEIMEKMDTMITADPNGNYYISHDSYIAPVLLDDKIKIDPQTKSGSTKLDSLKVDPIQSSEVRISLKTFDPAIAAFHGNEIAVPAFQFSIPQQKFQSVGSFDYIKLEPNQNVTLSVTNQLPVPIDSVTIYLYEINPQRLIISHSVKTPIPSGIDQNILIAVGGKTLTNDMSVKLTGYSSGSSDAIPIDSTKSVKLKLKSGTMRIEEALAKVVAATFSSKDSISITHESVTPTEIEIKTGTMTVTIDNKSEITGKIRVTSKQLKTSKNGTAFDKTISLLSKSVSPPLNLSLDGYYLNLTTTQSKVLFDIKVDIDSSTTFKTIRKSDVISYKVDVLNIRPNKVTGQFSKTLKSTTPDTVTLTYSKEIKNADLFFASGNTDMNLKSSIGLPVEVNPFVIMKFPNGSIDTLKFKPGIFPMVIPAATDINPVKNLTKSIQLSDMIGFNEKLNQKPNKIWFYANAAAAPTGLNDGYIYDTSSVSGSLSSFLPVHIKTNTGIAVSQKQSLTPEIIEETIKSTELFTRVTNNLPFKTTLRIAFLGIKGDTLMVVPKNTNGNPNYFTIPQPDISADGRVTAPLEYVMPSIKFSRAELDLLGKTFSVDLQVKVFTSNTTTGNFIRINSSDFLKIRMFSTIGLGINTP